MFLAEVEETPINARRLSFKGVVTPSAEKSKKRVARSNEIEEEKPAVKKGKATPEPKSAKKEVVQPKSAKKELVIKSAKKEAPVAQKQNMNGSAKKVQSAFAIAMQCRALTEQVCVRRRILRP